MAKGQIKNLEKLKISEIFVKFFRVFNFVLQSNRKLRFKNL